MLELIFIIPMTVGLVALFLPVNIGRGALVVTALIHLQLTVMAWLGKLSIHASQYFYTAPSGMLVLLVTSFIFLCISVYALHYMQETVIQKEPVFLGCMMLFLGTMSMVALADHPVVLWIAIEATTLVSSAADRMASSLPGIG